MYREISVDKLSGPALDWAVAVVEDKRPHLTVDNQVRVVGQWGEDYSVSFEAHKRWGIAGPIIERKRISIKCNSDDWAAVLWKEKRRIGMAWMVRTIQYGDTPLEAAMRCLVASELGETVTVPAVLLDDEAAKKLVEDTRDRLSEEATEDKR